MLKVELRLPRGTWLSASYMPDGAGGAESPYEVEVRRQALDRSSEDLPA